MLSVNARWWVLLAAIAVLVGAALAYAEGPYTLATGAVSPKDDEAAGCYFPVGTGQDALVIITHPLATSCVRLRELAGTSIQLIAVVEPK